MKTKLLLAGLFAAAAIPAFAVAQPYDPGCVQANHDNHVAGTIIGGVAGAVIGGAIGSANHNTGAGVAIGGVTGAVAGNAISHSNDHPCPDGYVYQGPPPQQYPDQYPNQYPDRRADFWYGAPEDVSQRIDFMQTRINQLQANGWISWREDRDLNSDLNDIRRQRDSLRYRDGGRLSPQDRDYLQSRLDTLSQRLHWQTAYPGPRANNDFWYGAPAGVNERIDFMQTRINQSQANGWISWRENRDLNSDLNDIRQQRDSLRYRDGGRLSPQDRDYLQSRLDTLSQRLHWRTRD